jgi:hypothetical protein
MTGAVVFDPFFGWPILAGFVALGLVILTLALWRRMAGTGLRFLAMAVVLGALANPSWQEEDRAALSDIVVVLVDESASQRIADRAAQTESALADLLARLSRIEGTEVRVHRFGDSEDNRGSLAMAALAESLSDLPRARLGGVVLISDGQIHDAQALPELPAPLHLLMTGQPSDWDRRLIIKTAPTFAIVGEPTSIVLRIEDQGAVPASLPPEAMLEITLGEDDPFSVRVPVGEDLELPLNLPHGGLNVVQLAVPPETGELTERNNAAIVQINAVRDRLRVLLVSGEPHAGERVWRNLLKSDAQVDLVHFTILRPPEKQDGVPVTELSLIAFPTRELFVDKIDEFDLIIFDRYRRRGILPMSYLENVRDYVRNGGAVLVSSGPEFGSADSLWRSPLSEVLPVQPSSRVLEQGFTPVLTETGKRHPVTAGLDEGTQWGRWFRQIEVAGTGGQVVMEGIDALPLLVLDRVSEGRVGVLASDHIWLWGRGFEGGGPQLELLRRLAHWTMKEPELEEEVLMATASGQRMTIQRRTLGDAPGSVVITAPDGSTTDLALREAAPGRWVGEWDAAEQGLYRLTEGDLRAVVALGPSAPREFEETIASATPMAQALSLVGGGAFRLSDGVPDIRRVAEGRVAHGRGWFGLTPREAYQTQDIRIAPVLPAWALLLLAAALALAAWLWEGRRTATAGRP